MRFLIVLVSCAAGALTPQQSIEEVANGTRTVADASWWGFNAEDATDALQAAIDSPAAVVVVPFMGDPWIVRPLTLRSNLELRFEPGVVVEAKRGEYQNTGDSLFDAARCTGVTLRGYGATLRMHKEDYRAEPYKKGEWRMVLAFLSCTDVLVEGLRLESSGGDGIYLGVNGDEQPYCKNVVIRDVICHDNYRQGISVISAENLLIENCVLSNTEGTAPAAGIDFEPNGADERLVNCVMKNCTSSGNQGAGILLYLKQLDATTPPLSITVESCMVEGGESEGIVVGAIGDNGPQGEITFRNCTVRGADDAAVEVYDKSATAAHITFTECTFDTRGKTKEAPIRLILREPKFTKQPGGITFASCRVFDDQDRPFMAYATKDESIGLSDVHGDIQVINPHGARVDVKPDATAVTLEVTQP